MHDFNTDYIRALKVNYGVHTIVVDDNGQAWGRPAVGSDLLLPGVVFDTHTIDTELAALERARDAIDNARG